MSDLGDQPASADGNDEIARLRESVAALERRLADVERVLVEIERAPAASALVARLPAHAKLFEAQQVPQVPPPQVPPPQVPPPLPSLAPARSSPSPVATARHPLAAAAAAGAPPPIPIAMPAARPPSRSLESIIGQNWASWIGGIVLFLGVVFFLKYAWDKGWIQLSATARVIAAVILGVALGALGEWTHRKRLKVLAGSLYGVGFAVTVAAFFAANVYFDPPVMPRAAAFICVAFTAAIAIAAALHINSIVLATLGLIGAYASPFVLSSGQDHSLFALSYILVLTVSGWSLNFVKPNWLPLRWLVLVCTYLSLFAWWASTGQRHDHDTLALVFTCLFYAGFVAEMILALRRHPDDPRSPYALPRGFDGMLAVMSLIVTAATFAMLGWLYGPSSPRVLGAFAVGLAGAQVFAATFTRSIPWRLGAILQAAALLTVAVPLFLDQFAVTLAWLALAMVLAVLAWRLHLAAVRAWSVVLLVLAVVRLLAFDQFNPALRAAQFTIAGQEVTRWLLLGWSIALLFHVIAWLKPRERAPSHLLDAWIPTVASNRFARALDYATTPRAIPVLDRTDAGGAFLAVIGTILFAGVTAMRWGGPMLTLALVAWLAPIALLARAVRQLGYGPHAAALALLVSARWIFFDNLDPLIDTWNRGQSLPPIVNLPALCGVLLAAAVLLVCWDDKLLGLAPRDRERDRELSQSHQISPRLFAIVFAAAVGFALLNFEIWRTIDWLDATGHVSIADRAIVKQVSMSVLWAIIGFGGVVFGFRRHVAPVRWAALVLLGITLAKILVIDMAEVKAIWRILSFVAVGLLLLCVSFVYHKQTEAAS